MADEKKGITVKIDADLHAEIREYLERHEGMTMAEFITLAVDDELHPKIQQKEGNTMGNMRTMAFQVPDVAEREERTEVCVLWFDLLLQFHPKLAPIILRVYSGRRW